MKKERLNAISLFSGIGGFEIGIGDYCRTVLYCEADKHAQGVLLSRMVEGKIDCAPICTDVREITGEFIDIPIDIIFGGFPCQDISVAGKGVGLEGERSGLFFEIVRLAKEIKPSFLFLENVPAIRTRGLDRVIEELTEIGYDLRWCMLSASRVGANHKRERWFLLAHTKQPDSGGRSIIKHATDQKRGNSKTRRESVQPNDRKTCPNYTKSGCSNVADTEYKGLEGLTERQNGLLQFAERSGERLAQSDLGGMVDGPSSNVVESLPEYLNADYWKEEPEDIPRVTEDKEQRVERIKRLGNAVVPLQVRVAFEYLGGIQNGRYFNV